MAAGCLRNQWLSTGLPAPKKLTATIAAVVMPISRIFLVNHAKAEAFVEAVKGAWFFVTSYRGVLESVPSHVLTFQLQGSKDLVDWKYVNQAQPGGESYFTWFEVESESQAIIPIPINTATSPPNPSWLGLDPSRGGASSGWDGVPSTWYPRYSHTLDHRASQRVTLDTSESAIMVSTKSWANQDTVLLGWASPLEDPENLVLDFSMKFADVSSDSVFGVIATRTTDRAIVSDTPEAGKVSMNMIIRRDGRIELHVRDGMDGGPSAVSSEAAIPSDLIALNVWVPCRLTVTPSSITLERLDKPGSANIVNNQVRGAYRFAGAKGANVKFRSMTLSE